MSWSTSSDSSIQTASERERAYWQHDHVRTALECGDSLAAHYGLLDPDDTFVCGRG